MSPQPQTPSRSVFSLLALVAVTLLVALMALPRFSFAQEPSRRLILKDGSYQLVTHYEVKSDRVRYFSAEREEWEELPASLVDWPATDKYEKDRAAAGASAPEAVQFDKDLDHERELEEAAQPQVAPGLRLPEDSGVFLLDTFQNEPQLVEVQQTSGDVNRSTKGNILYGAINPIAGLKQAIELEGAHAKVQSHVDVPSLYINVEPIPGQPDQANPSGPSPGAAQPQQPQQPEQPLVPFDRFRIIRAEVKGNKRILGDVKRAVTGKITQQEHFVPTTITGITGGWLKLTPTSSLAPGEYALVEMVGKEGMNLDVWDFGVNPKAPANANPWKPEVKNPPAPADKRDN
ncbi:conserved exported hypothetical protein [Candidatus Sulfotelmatobacter kueseliae]|uniref:Uncharacterized protein n=1 Tax=Candidatus Sulfotelmatobacter kueseliae TaxID=2042962 RepID=A0A2U3KRN7_9BACT|nr:conserved exported hypothetical protein [Candidatus Sulfotelmatobacter kueseliae]